MQPITFEDFEVIRAQNKYYALSRWEYFKLVILLAGEPDSVLELGAYLFPLFPEGDTMDCMICTSSIPTIQHNATKFPWPFENKQYDLFIALQVWEHLENLGQKAFCEVMRIANRAILSFPYMWNVPKDEKHHMITKEMILEWTCGVPYTTAAVSYSKFPRVVLYFEFDK